MSEKIGMQENIEDAEAINKKIKIKKVNYNVLVDQSEQTGLFWKAQTQLYSMRNTFRSCFFCSRHQNKMSIYCSL